MRLPTVARIRLASLRDVTWLQWLETLLFALPPIIGVGVVGVLEGVAPGRLRLAFVAFGTVGFLTIRVGVPLCLYFDARSIGAESGDWRPNEWLYMVTAAAISAPLVAIFYLHRRHRHVDPVQESSIWWYVVSISLVVPLVGLSVAVIGLVLATPSIVGTGIGLAGAIVLGAFPAGIYKDAAHVRAHSATWRPNPGTYLGLAFVSIAIAPLQPLVTLYYLVRRRNTTLLS